MTQELRRGRHCVFELNVHLVFVTKYRRSIFTEEHLDALEAAAAKVAVSSLVNSLKGVTSRRLRSMFPEVEASYYKGQLWSPSYFAASCGGAPLEKTQGIHRRSESPCLS